jgi:hypothetical protein
VVSKHTKQDIYSDFYPWPNTVPFSYW